MDVRPGGVWRLTMRGPDGREYKNASFLSKSVKPERLVYKHDPEEGCEPVRFEITVTFARGGRQNQTHHANAVPVRRSAAITLSKVRRRGRREANPRQAGGVLCETLARLRTLQCQVISPAYSTRRASWSSKPGPMPKRLKHWWGPERIHRSRLRTGSAPRRRNSNSHARAGRHRVSERGIIEEFVPPERLVLAMGVEDRKAI